MPVRRGHIAPKNTYIDILIKKFDNQYAAFIITNSKIALNPIIYCSADFCDLFSFTKAQLLLKSSSLSFLFGEKTTLESIQALSDGLVCDREVKILLSLYTRKDEVRQCELTITPLTDELGRISLHIIFFEAVEQVQLDKRPTRRVSSRRLSNIATMIFHRSGKEIPKSNLKRTHHLSQSVRNELLPKEVVLSRRTSENIPIETNNRMSVSSLFLSDLKNPPEAVDTKKCSLPYPESLQLCTRFDSGSMDTGNSVTLRSSAQTSRASVGNEPPAKRSEIRPKSCTNAPLFSVLQSSETESTTDRVRPASAVLGARCSRYAIPSLIARGSRLLSAPVSQTSLVLSDAGTLQVVLGKHGDQSKSHVTDTFAKILSLDKDLHEKRKLESKQMHKYTLKHYSPIRAVWDWFILILVIYTAIFTPYNAAFLLNHNVSECPNPQLRSPGQQTILGIVDKLVDVMFFMDIIINFRTTYVNKNDEVVSQPKKIAFHYLKSWFIIDLIAAIPFDAVISKSYEKQQPTALTGLLKSARLLRLINVVRKLDRYSEYGTAILVLLTSIFVLIAHWLACIWYAIGNTEHHPTGWLATLAEQTRQPYNGSSCSGPTLQTKYITALYFTFSSLTSIGFGNVSPNTNAEKIFSIIVMLVGSLMYASIFGNVSAIIQRLYSGTARYHAQMLRVKEFIRFHQIPGALRQRLEDYFIHAWAYTYGIDMSVVQRSFPECLQSDICMHVYKTMLKSTRAFEGLTDGCLRTFALRIRTVHLPPGDTLIHAGGLLTTLYFVEQGSLEVLDPSDGAILAVLSKGDFFGGLPPLHQPQSLKSRGSRGLPPGLAPRSLVVAKSRFVVRALTYCDLHYVERDEFAALLLSYPEFVENLVSHFELTVPLAGSGPYFTEADLFCMNRDEKRQQSVSSPCIPPVYLHKDGAVELMTRFSSSCIFTETPLLQVPPPPSQNPSRARLPESWLSPARCRRSKLCSWELERLQRLLEHSTTGVSDDEMVVPPGGDSGERDSSTSPTATTIATSTSHGDLEERLSAQMAQRFSKMELNLMELEEKMTNTFVSLMNHLQCPQSRPPVRISVDASTMTDPSELSTATDTMPGVEIRAVSEEELRAWGSKIRDPSSPLVERAHAMWGLRHAKEALATRLLAAYVTEVHPPEPESNALLQHEAAYCLGQRGDPSAIPDLEKALRDPRHEPIVRHEAAEALAALASTPGADTEYIKGVLKEFRDINIVAVAETCEVGLGRIEWLQRPEKIPDPAAELAQSEFPNTVDPAPSFEPSTKYSISQLSRILLSPSESLFARYQALFSLRNAAVITRSGKSEPSIHFSDVVEALSASLSAPGSALLRHEVAFILGQLSISRTGDSLIERLQDHSEAPMVRHEAAMALGEVAGTAEVDEKQGLGDGGCGGLAERARKALLASCKDPEPVVRDSCALALDMADYVSSNERFQFAEVPAH